MVFQWKEGSRHKVPANVAAKVMNKLADENQLNAETLVDVSRPEEAPMHPEFEWNDAIAAEEWRKEQARSCMRSLVVITESEDDIDVQPTRVFVQIEQSSSNYEPMNIVLLHEDKIEALRKQALVELMSFRNKYKQIIDLTDSKEEADAFIQKLAALSDEMRK